MKQKIYAALIIVSCGSGIGADASGVASLPNSKADAAADVDGASLPGSAELAPPTNLLRLEAVLAEVIANNPNLKAARANWQAMELRVPQEGAWADPRVGVDVERSGTTRFFTFTDNEWMVSQELPLSGKNRRRARAASAEAATAFAQVDRRRLELMRDARVAFYNLVNAQKQIELNEKNAELLKQFSEITRVKYEAGTRMQSDVLMAQTELLRNQEARRDLDQQLAEAQYRLNVLMNRKPDTPLGHAETVEIPRFNYDAQAIEGHALVHRPELRATVQKIAAASARQDVAKRAWIPDPELRVEARQFNGGGARIQEYDTGIFFSFPWFNRSKYRAGIAEAKKNRESAEYELAALEAETRGLVREHLKRIETMHHHYTLFRNSMAPLALQNVTATRLAYETDKTGFLNLIDAQRALREIESMAQQHLTSYLAALAELEALAGTHLQVQPPSAVPDKKDAP